MQTRAILFDAYGTLFDVHSVAARAEALFPGRGNELSALWRIKQLEYTWLRSLSGRYADFWSVTRDALTYACKRLKLRLTEKRAQVLMQAYLALTPFQEVLGVLRSLQSRGLRLGILSNGTPRMLDAAVTSAGLNGLFEHVLSVDSAKVFKTDFRCYRLGLDAFKPPANDIVFVSSNGWDAAGAAWFGYRAFWVNRQGAPVEALGVEPAGTGRTLKDLLTFV